MQSATPTVVVKLCDRNSVAPGNCSSGCQDGYCGTCLVNRDCQPRSLDVFGNVNETGNILAYGIINDDCGTDDPSIDQGWRPKCGCNMYDMNYYHIGNSTRVIEDGKEWAVYPYTLCYPPFKGPNECYYANAGPCVSFKISNGSTYWIPYFAPQDPVFCADMDNHIDVACQRDYESGLRVNGPPSFCSDNACDPSSPCNCTYGFVRKNCTIEGKEVFKMTFKSLTSGFTSERVELNPSVPFSIDDTTCKVSVTGSSPILMDNGFNKVYLNPGTHDLCRFEGREITFTHEDSRRTILVPRKIKEQEKDRNVLWICFVILSLTLIGGLFLILSFLLASYVYSMRVTKRVLRGFANFAREFKPERATLILMIVCVGAVKTSYNTTHDCYVRSGCSQGTLDICGSTRVFNEITCYERPTYNCKVIGSCNGDEETYNYSEVNQCEIRTGFQGVYDTIACSGVLTGAITILIVILLVCLCMVVTPSAWATFLLISSLVPRVNSCTVSQTIQSGSQSCFTSAGSTTCSYDTTLDFSIGLGETFCADFTNSYGQVNQAIRVEFTSSTTYALEKSLFYTSSFETYPSVRFSCNDCFLSCSGDCSKDACNLANGGLNPNGQINSANNWCTGMSGCELTDEGACIFGDNCQWWQASLCPNGVTSLVKEITGSTSVQTLSINNNTFLSSQPQPARVGDFLISTSSAQDPVNFGTLGIKSRLLGLSTVCSFLPTNTPTSGTLGDLRCKTPNCTESIATASFPEGSCTFLGSDTIQCAESFVRNIRSQSQCSNLPTVREGVFLSETGDGRLSIQQVQPAKVRVLLSLQGYNVSYTSELSTIKLKDVTCKGVSNQTGGVEIYAKADCNPPGRINLRLESQDTTTGSTSALCLSNFTIRATSNSKRSSGTLFVGSKIQNDSRTFSCDLEDFVGKVDRENVTTETVAETENDGLWGRIFDGDGSFLDWFWAFLEISLLLALIALMLFLVWLCLPFLLQFFLLLKSCAPKMDWKKKSKKEKDPEVMPTKMPTTPEAKATVLRKLKSFNY